MLFPEPRHVVRTFMTGQLERLIEVGLDLFPAVLTQRYFYDVRLGADYVAELPCGYSKMPSSAWQCAIVLQWKCRLRAGPLTQNRTSARRAREDREAARCYPPVQPCATRR
jgi:hypothetical protein